MRPTEHAALAERPGDDLEALVIRERAQTIRLALCAAAAVALMALLIPTANSRPSWRKRRAPD